MRKLDESIDFGEHHPCVVWRQTSPLGQVRHLGGLLGQDLYLEDFLPLVVQWRSRWFPAPCEVRTCCDPAGATDNSQGVRDNGVGILRVHKFKPQWRTNPNRPDARVRPHLRTSAPADLDYPLAFLRFAQYAFIRLPIAAFSAALHRCRFGVALGFHAALDLAFGLALGFGAALGLAFGLDFG